MDCRHNAAAAIAGRLQESYRKGKKTMSVQARRVRRSREVLHRYVPRTGSVKRTLLLTGIAVVTLGASTGAAVSATAAHHHRHGKFSCEAWGANLGGATFAVANKHYTPCYNKHGRVNKAGRTLSGAGVKLGVITSNTEMKGHRVIRAGKTKALASARTAKAKIATLKIGAATSSATYTCVAKGHKLVPKLRFHSNVAYIITNGKKQKIGSKSQTKKLGPLGLGGTIRFNRVIKSGRTITVRAVEIDLGGKKPTIVLAQSRVSYTGNPCAK
jgi:hypothetical protein